MGTPDTHFDLDLSESSAGASSGCSKAPSTLFSPDKKPRGGSHANACVERCLSSGVTVLETSEEVEPSEKYGGEHPERGTCSHAIFGESADAQGAEFRDREPSNASGSFSGGSRIADVQVGSQLDQDGACIGARLSPSLRRQLKADGAEDDTFSTERWKRRKRDER